MKILIINSGSSSLKYNFYEWEEKKALAFGIIEKIGEDFSIIKYTNHKGDNLKLEEKIKNHEEALEKVFKLISSSNTKIIDSLSEIKAVGHRIVHGGYEFTHSVLLTDDVLNKLKAIEHLAPLHNPANILGIEACLKIFKNNIPQVLCFDTSWHQSMPKKSFLYALPYDWYSTLNIRRYGFHGLSYAYVARRAANLLKKKLSETNLIIAHLGNGASINAVKNGLSYDTSMGFTPLEGLVMGTRSGDIDPAIISFVNKHKNLSAQEIDSILNKKSGLLGISGISNDLRDIIDGRERANERCKDALDVLEYRVKKYIGAYLAALDGKVDAICFTAGGGEMSAPTREGALKGLESLGIEIDTEKNNIALTRNAESLISKESSKIKIFVIPTNEELLILEDTFNIINDNHRYTYSFEESNYKNTEREIALKEELKAKPELSKVIIR